MKSTFLYIKQHHTTGKLYFGKTQMDPYVYKGSGKYWLSHLKKHGRYVDTIWVSEPFVCKEEIEEFAIFFSDFFNIVNDDKWANLIVENGIDGAPKGAPNKGPSGKNNGMYGKCGHLNPFFGKKHSEEQKKKWSDMRLGELNINFGAKSFTEKTRELLRRPKQNKENYKGTPGKVTCINREGKPVQILSQHYRDQKLLSSDPSDWDYVSTRSKEAAKRKLNNLGVDV